MGSANKAWFCLYLATLRSTTLCASRRLQTEEEHPALENEGNMFDHAAWSVRFSMYVCTVLLLPNAILSSNVGASIFLFVYPKERLCDHTAHSVSPPQNCIQCKTAANKNNVTSPRIKQALLRYQQTSRHLGYCRWDLVYIHI